jgi:hypothetical protein
MIFPASAISYQCDATRNNNNTKQHNNNNNNTNDNTNNAELNVVFLALTFEFSR